LGIIIHGTFIMGLPGETRGTIEETIRFSKEINPRTMQVSLAAAYPGTELDRVARENNWIIENKDIRTMVAGDGVQVSSISYPHLSHKEIFDAVAEMYKCFYFRPSKIAEIVGEMLMSWDVLKRRLREGVEFIHFLRAREDLV
jgi:radical SAM superfamily enzyme YgiQ (UPF0313 family)